MQPDPILVANTAAWLRKAAQDLARVERCLAEENPDVEGIEPCVDRQRGRCGAARAGPGPPGPETARILVETTRLSMADIAFASGFSSVRQFNATVAEVYACTPTELRGKRRPGSTTTPGRLDIRLAVRRPFDGDDCWPSSPPGRCR